ncbi:MAG: dihydropteroate synthase [Candidatus Scalindua rubra]|uniref:Dihydropteroate synthase n=1 Tax=Candidatus Scalindua rubra TaxID=1872076 RepID=A0A1E3XCA6_9BACT|nr:MAG: dihydropteroate synthase [Candidatus Scalindua rubra]
MIIRHNKGYLEIGEKTLVTGILNVTPDSFYDGGKYNDLESALNHARKMIEDGADIIDIGGESTRPGSSSVSADEEIRRVIPIIKELSKETQRPISIDTYKAEVADEAIKAGAQIINDISGLQADNEMARVVAANNTPLIIMHIKGHPHNFPKNPIYDKLIPEVILFFKRRIEFAVESGITRNNIIIDPGIGFGKTPKHNLEILKQLNELKCLNLPIMIGTSHKSFINNVLELSEDNNIPRYNSRLIGTLVTLVIAIIKGVNIIRVHDVKESVQAIKMYEAIELTN